MKVLVVPSNRPAQLDDFIDAWNPVKDWDKLIVVFDGDEPPPIAGADLILSWPDIKHRLGDDSWIISKRSSAVRVIGYLAAWEMGAKYIATIDDDCRPAGYRLFEPHLKAMKEQPCWFNTTPGHRPRGLPYRNTGTLSNVVMNVGLWQNVGDWDAPTSLACEADLVRYDPPAETRVVPADQYLSVSSMNLAYCRCTLPLAYMPPMGENSPYDRFEDIWSGIVAKRICDHLGLSVTVGPPIVEHARASDPFVNLVKEAPGVGVNEWLWGEVQDIPLAGSTAMDCLMEASMAFQEHREEYFQTYGKALEVWVRRLQSNT